MRRPTLPRPAVVALLLLLAGLLAGCDLPRPFAHQDVGPPLARLATASGIAVVPPRGLPPDHATAAAEGLATALSAVELPAQPLPDAEAEALGGYIIRGLVGDDGLVWEVRAPEGRSLRLLRQAPPEDGGAGAWAARAAEAAPALADAIDRDSAAPLSQRMAAPAPPPLPGPAARDPGVPDVQLLRVDGLPDDRARLLLAAVRGALAARGLSVGAEAPLTVAGHVAVTPDEAGTLALRVTWTAFRADGREAGTAEQANSVPAALWEARFPALAQAIAEGAAEGIAAVARRPGGGAGGA